MGLVISSAKRRQPSLAHTKKLFPSDQVLAVLSLYLPGGQRCIWRVAKPVRNPTENVRVSLFIDLPAAATLLWQRVAKDTLPRVYGQDFRFSQWTS